MSYISRMNWTVDGISGTTDVIIHHYYSGGIHLPDEWTEDVRQIVALANREWLAAEPDNADDVTDRVAEEVERALCNIHTVTFRDVLAGRYDATFTVNVGDEMTISACCATDDESVMDSPAAFSVTTSWGGVGRFDGVDAHILKLKETISAEFGGTWHYSPSDSAIMQD